MKTATLSKRMRAWVVLSLVFVLGFAAALSLVRSATRLGRLKFSIGEKLQVEGLKVIGLDDLQKHMNADHQLIEDGARNRLKIAKSQLEKANEWLTAGLARFPNSPKLLDLRISVHLLAQDYESAKQDLLTIISLHSSNPQNYLLPSRQSLETQFAEIDRVSRLLDQKENGQ